MLEPLIQGHNAGDFPITRDLSRLHLKLHQLNVPPTGFEPVHPPPEGGALSPELRGRNGKVISSADVNNYSGKIHRIRSRMTILWAYCQNIAMNQSAYFATGCFWGAERRFWQLAGVIQTSVGYMGGTRPNPSYEQVCTGVTGHAEMVHVLFDDEQISYQRLLEEFWTMHDPTSLNQQGGDIGTQYRSSIYATTPEQLTQAIKSRDLYQEVLTKAGLDPIVSEILIADGVEYFIAEEYHQKYLQKNPNGYDCHSSTGVAFPVGVVL